MELRSRSLPSTVRLQPPGVIYGTTKSIVTAHADLLHGMSTSQHNSTVGNSMEPYEIAVNATDTYYDSLYGTSSIIAARANINDRWWLRLPDVALLHLHCVRINVLYQDQLFNTFSCVAFDAVSLLATHPYIALAPNTTARSLTLTYAIFSLGNNLHNSVSFRIYRHEYANTTSNSDTDMTLVYAFEQHNDTR